MNKFNRKQFLVFSLGIVPDIRDIVACTHPLDIFSCVAMLSLMSPISVYALSNKEHSKEILQFLCTCPFYVISSYRQELYIISFFRFCSFENDNTISHVSDAHTNTTTVHAFTYNINPSVLFNSVCSKRYWLLLIVLRNSWETFPLIPVIKLALHLLTLIQSPVIFQSLQTETNLVLILHLVIIIIPLLLLL